MPDRIGLYTCLPLNQRLPYASSALEELSGFMNYSMKHKGESRFRHWASLRREDKVAELPPDAVAFLPQLLGNLLVAALPNIRLG